LVQILQTLILPIDVLLRSVKFLHRSKPSPDNSGRIPYELIDSERAFIL